MLDTAQLRTEGVEEVLFIADACLGGLRGRSTLLIGPEERRQLYLPLLQKAGMKNIYQEDSAQRVSELIPYVQLLISAPDQDQARPLLTAGLIARGCLGRRTPLLIFDLSPSTPSVEELAGLLPAVCLYTPEDLRHVLSKHG
ncbi:MAG: hypothetical protein ACJ788_18570 [Ktedonobacteraceae bacterium]